MTPINITSPRLSKDLDVFVIAGQSNATAAPTVDHRLRRNEDARALAFVNVDEHVDLLRNTGGGWVPMDQIYRVPNLHYGAERGLVSWWVEHTGRPPAIIKLASSGSGIYNDWAKGVHSGRDLYDWFFTQMVIAAAGLDAAGHTWRIKGICWLQGETEAQGSETRADEYGASCLQLMTDLSTDLRAAYPAHVPDPLPIVLTKIATSYPYAATVRAAIESVADTLPAGAWVDIDDQPRIPGNSHFDSHGLETVGARWAESLYGLQS